MRVQRTKRSGENIRASAPPHSRSDGTIPAPGVLDDERFAKLISLNRLRQTWKAIRREARDHRIRDVVDFLDWAQSIDSTLADLSRSLSEGTFKPSAPHRYELAKSHGAFRVMTIPSLRDALVYRVISDEALALAMPQKVAGAFFSRRHSATPVGRTLTIEDDPYLRFLDIWLRYQEYRTRTLLKDPHDYLVVSDIANFFDSISHDLLLEYLAPLGLPRKAVGLLLPRRLVDGDAPRLGDGHLAG